MCLHPCYTLKHSVMDFLQPVKLALLWTSQILNVTLPFFSGSAPALSFSTQEQFIARCSSFAREASIPGATIHFSHYLNAGTNLSLSENHASCGASHWIVPSDICRIALTVPTSDTSEMSVEAWFPYDYAGRFLTTTNRGTNDC